MNQIIFEMIFASVSMLALPVVVYLNKKQERYKTKSKSLAIAIVSLLFFLNAFISYVVIKTTMFHSFVGKILAILVMMGLSWFFSRDSTKVLIKLLMPKRIIAK